jgi:SOS response regulatory protein OraA/RecX
VFATVERESSRGCWKAVAEDSSFLIPVRIFLSEKLGEGEGIDQKRFEELRRKCSLEECYQKALGLLGSREHSRMELSIKLSKRGFQGSVIAEVLDALETEGALDEVRYCTEFARSRLKRSPEGRVLMEMRLAAKGARRECIKEALDALYTPEYSDELALEALKAIKCRYSDENAIRTAFAKAGFTSYQFQVAKELAD